MWLSKQAFAVFFALSTVTSAWESPQYSGFSRQWQATFVGSTGTAPHPDNWRIVTGDQNDNNEFQRYTGNKANLQFSGKGALQIIPRRDSSAPKGWTSARIESKYNVLPKDGKVTRVEASLRVGSNAQANKQGLWYAGWLLGASFRQGVSWPACGEIDLMENINGQASSVAVVHCDVYPGGACKEPEGLVQGVTLPDSKFHVWRVEFDRRKANFKDQSITWYMDGKRFHQVTGAQINNSKIWATLAQSPYYIILNVAVGGNWPGAPNANTWGGEGSMMEVGYVAHYVST